MKKSEAVKFPNSIQLFKFCHKLLVQQSGNQRVNDQELGNILEYNPSDCSHWKRGEKNVKSVFALAKLSDALNVEPSIIHDLAFGTTTLDEAYFEYSEANQVSDTLAKAYAKGEEALQQCRQRILNFVGQLQIQSGFAQAPLYIPEVVRLFSFVQLQPSDMIDRLSRVLRTKPGQYTINYRKGDLKAQTRVSILKDLARIILEGERSRFPELGKADEALLAYENLLFVNNILVPQNLLKDEMSKVDPKRNLVQELSTVFWAPKTLIANQICELVGRSLKPQAARAKVPSRILAAPSTDNRTSMQEAG